MSYVDFLKKEETFDKYVLLLLSLGMSVEEVSKKLKITRQTIYNVIKRNQRIVEQFKINK